MDRLIPWALVAFLTVPLARADESLPSPGRATLAAEVVVTVTGDGALVGVGEPPYRDRIGALVYLEDGGASVITSVRSLAAALGGTPTVRRFCTADAPADAIVAADAAIAATDLPAVAVDVTTGAIGPGAQMTADRGGYHRRDGVGRAAADALGAVRAFSDVASYGHGHAPPMFEGTADGAMQQVRPDGWDQPTQAYACPFPSTPGLEGPTGMAVEMSLAAGRTASEEAFAAWCERTARNLASSCDATEILDAFESGPIEVAFGDPPAVGLWWLHPESAAPAGGSSVSVACAADALMDQHVAALHPGILLRITLVESDLTEGCRRMIEESCK